MKTKLTNNLKLGKTYLFMGYNWTVCELVNDGRTAVLQSHGVTSGAWPGFKMAEFGNGDYYADSIDGQDISAYDHKLKELYNAIKDVEDKSATYGKGLYLVSKEKVGVSKEKVGFTKCGEHGSGYYCTALYWTALKEAAMNYRSFGAASNGAWLGTVSGSGNPLCVDSNGGVYNGNPRSSGFVVAPAFNLDLSKVEVAGDEIIKKAQPAPSSFEHDDNCQEHQLLGKTYKFAGYKWTACELINNGKTLVIQSHGVTHGKWPGYKMLKFGGNVDNFYAADIDGEDISAYDDKMRSLYDAIKDAEDSSASYGKGLYLIPKEKAGFTRCGEPGSGNYWKALKAAAENASSFGAVSYNAWLGTVYGGNYAWYVYSGGNVYNNGSGQSSDYVVAPAFNLDLSKVEVAGDEIVIKESDHIDQSENQPNSAPYRSIWEYGMDLTKNGETMHVTPEMVRQIFEAIKEDNGRNYVASYTSRKFTREQYIAVCDEVENRLADDSGDAEYRACEHVLGEGFDKTETWIIKSMFTANHESRTVEHPEKFSSEQKAWNKVKSLALADQDGNEITEVKYDRDACQVTMIHANKTVCWISAEKK